MLGVIINPKSGSAAMRKQRLWLFRMLRGQHKQFVYKVTQYAGHATELARELAEKGYDEILVLGGDGTLSEVVEGLMHANISDEQRKNICFGLIPRGTGNDWARYWELNNNYKRSIDIYLNHGKQQPIDIGCVTLKRNGIEEKHYFVNSIGFGIDAKTAQRADVMRYYVGSHGLNYFFGLISAVFTHRSVSLNVVTDSGLQISEPMFAMNIGNGPFCGGGISLNPKADPTDGKFHSMFIGRPTFSLIMSALPKLFNGRLLEISFIQNFTAKSLLLDTSKHLIFEKDGIIINACGPFKIELIPAALKMMVGNDNNG